MYIRNYLSLSIFYNILIIYLKEYILYWKKGNIMPSKRTHHELQQYSIFKPLVFTTVIILIILAYYIPHITDKNAMETIKKNSLKSVEQIKLTRAYYVENVVRDLKKYAPQIAFSYKHEGVNGVVPLPTTLIRNLSDIFSEHTGTKYRLYSEYPFKNRKDRNLSEFQKEALHYTQKNPDGIYVKRDMINGEPVLRVAVTDYMTSQACVDCHNNHPDRTWEKGKWKLGDKRGVLEVITPMKDEIAANSMVKYSILGLITTMVLLLMGYYSYMFFRREKELVQTIEEVDQSLQEEIIISTKKGNLLEEYKKAIDLSAIVSKTDINGVITYANYEFCRISKYCSDKIIGKKHNIVRHPDQDPEEYERLWKTILDKKIYRGTLKNRAKDGRTYYVDATIIPILDTQGEIIEFLAIRYDVTEHMKTIEFAYTDTLTGIPNRNQFERVMLDQLEEVERHGKPFTLALLDIDDFKTFNDIYGHLIGDEILVMLAKKLKKILRSNDFIARWGGEEFVILLRNTDLEEALKRLNEIRTALSDLKHEKAGRVTVSFGVTQYREGDTLASILNRADKALYKAKNDGKNCIRTL